MALQNQFSNVVINRYANVSDKYEVIERIGRGSFGIVMMAKDVITKEKMAIKIMELDFLQEDECKKLIEEIMKEAALMSIFDHPNILKYHECFQYSYCLCIVLEYCQETLTNVLRTHIKDNTRPSKQLIIEWFYKLSQGLDYLHDKNIIHRDIKPMNILFKNSEIKIADFGESRIKSQATMTVRGTPAYMSPEMLRNERFNEKTDIWSLGCVFYEIYYLEMAFDGKNHQELRINILNRRIRHLNNDNSEIANLIDMMLEMDKNERISIKEVLSHNVFKDLTNDTNKKDKKDENNGQILNIEKLGKKDERKEVTMINEGENTDDIPKLVELCKSRENNFEQIRKLIKRGHVNVNYKNENGETAVKLASENGHKEVVELLIQNGAVVNENDNNGWTALIKASENGHKEVVELLIQNGAIVNQNENNGWTSLMSASRNGHKEVVALLIENKALVNQRDNDGYTALIYASVYGHKEVVELLIKKNAIVNQKDNRGMTALISASWSGRKEVVELLVQNNGVVNEMNNFGCTALYYASHGGHKEVVKYLKSKGAVDKS